MSEIGVQSLFLKHSSYYLLTVDCLLVLLQLAYQFSDKKLLKLVVKEMEGEDQTHLVEIYLV